MRGMGVVGAECSKRKKEGWGGGRGKEIRQFFFNGNIYFHLSVGTSVFFWPHYEACRISFP